MPEGEYSTCQIPSLISEIHLPHPGRIVLNLVYTFDNVEREPIGYRVHKTQALAHIFSQFAQYMRRPVTHFTFKLDGVEVQSDRTPISLGLRDGDSIMVHESSGMMRFVD